MRDGAAPRFLRHVSLASQLVRLALAALVALSACASPPGSGIPTALSSAAAPSMALDSLVRADADLQYAATVRFPVLTGAGPHTDAVNTSLRRDAQAQIDAPAVQPDPDLATVPVEDRTASSSTELDAGVQAERLDARVFSANRSVWAYTGGAHGNYWFDPVNVDLRTGERIALEDLFAPGSRYLERLSAGAERSLRAGGWDLDASWAEGLAPDADNFGAFTLAADSLVLHFAPYQIGPYAAGSFRAAVAYADLPMAEDAPVGR